MRIAKVTLAIVFVASLIVSTVTGSFADEGGDILDLAWGRMTLIDLYVGVALVWGWVLLRERRTWVAIAWLPVFVVLGHGGTALYAAIASFRADDVRSFLLGARS